MKSAPKFPISPSYGSHLWTNQTINYNKLLMDNIVPTTLSDLASHDRISTEIVLTMVHYHDHDLLTG
jgi:hypothetical protein